MTEVLTCSVIFLLIVISYLLSKLCDQLYHIEELKRVNRALREELVDLIRKGRVL